MRLNLRWFLAVAGVLGGLGWLALRFLPPACVPVTEASEVLCNRLWSPALLGMGLGFSALCLSPGILRARHALGVCLGLPVGCTLMLLGNGVEYWLLTDLPHQGPAGLARGLAWMTVLGGFFLFLAAATIMGFMGFKEGYLPRWLCGLLLLVFPLTLILAWVNMDFVGLPLGVVSVGAGLAGRKPLRQQ